MLPLALCTVVVAQAGAPAPSIPIQTTQPAETGFLCRTVKIADREHRYVLYVPRDYSPAKSWPTIVFLHGAGECGTDGLKQVAQGIGTAILLDAARWPFLVIFPQKPDVRDAWEDHDALVMATLAATEKSHRVDTARTYLTGLSQGGHGSWAIGSKHADRFAAVAPICGYGDPAAFAEPLKNTPVWCFHGDADTVVPLDRSQKIVDAIKAAGGSPKLTVYAGVGHNSWDKAYRDEPLPAWFLEHTLAK